MSINNKKEMKTHIPRRSQNIKPLITEFRKEVEKLYGNRFAQLILYGSYARGKQKEFSDIDLLVVVNDEVYPVPDEQKVSDITFEYTLEHEIVFHAITTTKQRFTNYKIPLYLNIQKEGIIV